MELKNKIKNRLFRRSYVFTKVSDIHIGFIYEELELDKKRYLNKGLIWQRKEYGFKSPKLSKMDTLCKKGLIRHYE